MAMFNFAENISHNFSYTHFENKTFIFVFLSPLIIFHYVWINHFNNYLNNRDYNYWLLLLLLLFSSL